MELFFHVFGVLAAAFCLFLFYLVKHKKYAIGDYRGIQNKRLALQTIGSLCSVLAILLLALLLLDEISWRDLLFFALETYFLYGFFVSLHRKQGFLPSIICITAYLILLSCADFTLWTGISLFILFLIFRLRK